MCIQLTVWSTLRISMVNCMLRRHHRSTWIIHSVCLLRNCSNFVYLPRNTILYDETTNNCKNQNNTNYRENDYQKCVIRNILFWSIFVRVGWCVVAWKQNNCFSEKLVRPYMLHAIFYFVYHFVLVSLQKNKTLISWFMYLYNCINTYSPWFSFAMKF